jgi:hypothetical protein
MAATAAVRCASVTGEHRSSAVAAMGSSYRKAVAAGA